MKRAAGGWCFRSLLLAMLFVAQPCIAATAISNASITATSLLAGASSEYEFTFRATSGLPTGATITVVYPSGFNVTGATKTQYGAGYLPIQGISGQTITYTVEAGSATNVGGTLYYFDTTTGGIVNPVTPGLYSVQISTSNDPTPVAVQVIITAAGGAISNASITATSLLAGASSEYEFTFRATSGLPTGATITVVYPSGFNVTGATKTQYGAG